MTQRPRPRSNLEPQVNARRAKSITRGFGIVRYLTNATQRQVFEALDEAEITTDVVRRRPPLHATVIGFVGMTRREQASFNAGFSVTRLEERLERGIESECPRAAVAVELGSVVNLGNYLYSKIEDDGLSHEQLQLAGAVALHGISVSKIDKRIVPTHMGIGFAQGPVEDIREQVEVALLGKVVALQRWNVYPERYA